MAPTPSLQKKTAAPVSRGNYVFVPTLPVIYTPTHHVDIMRTLEEDPPTEKVWKDNRLEKYGVIVVSGGVSTVAA